MSSETNDLVMRTEASIAYYKRQGVISDEEEQLLRSDRERLPLTFRVSLNNIYHHSTVHKLASIIQLQRLLSKESGGSVSCKLRHLTWYPGKVAYMVKIEGNLKHMLNKWVARANELGVVTLQDAASMVPPLLLKIKSHCRVLDMCAAPGSKTFQLVDMLHQTCEDSYSPTGFVIANDVSVKRLSILTHQLKRGNSPSVVVTNHKAEEFPLIYLPECCESRNRRGDEGELLKFDAILADVPCSCDGKLWYSFTKSRSAWFRNHVLQLKIVSRAAKLLKVGGRLVYSTCSLNPFENEAVIAALLTRCRGALHLVDVSAELVEFRRKPGLSDWNVFDEVAYHLPTQDEGECEEVPESAWPPSPAQSKEMRLELCWRSLPQRDNMDGFFVAVLQKSAELPEEFEYSAAHDANGGKSSSSAETGNSGCLSPVTDSVTINSVLDAYGIDGQKSGMNVGLLSRIGQEKSKCPKNLYYASRVVVDVFIKPNVLGCCKLKIFAAGVKLFERQASDQSACNYRLTQGGLHVAFPHLTRRMVEVTPLELEALLCRHQGETSSSRAPVPTASRVEDVPLGFFEKDSFEALQAVKAGCVIIVTRLATNNPEVRHVQRSAEVDSNTLTSGPAAGSYAAANDSTNNVALACWYGQGCKGRSLSVLASEAECAIMLHHLRLSLARK